MSCSDMKYSENFGQTVPGDSTLRMNQTKNRPVERSVASLFCWVTELKFDWLLSCYCTMESYFFEEAFLFHPPMFWRFIHDKCMIRRIDEKSCQIAEAKICFLKNYLTPLLWIAKTSATWRHKIASKSFDAFFPRKRRKVPRFQLNKVPLENQLMSVYCKVRIYLLPKFYANWGQDHYLPVLTVFIIGLPFLSHRLYLAPKYIHQRKVWKPGISLNSEMNEVFTLYCTAIWQL